MQTATTATEEEQKQQQLQVAAPPARGTAERKPRWSQERKDAAATARRSGGSSSGADTSAAASAPSTFAAHATGGLWSWAKEYFRPGSAAAAERREEAAAAAAKPSSSSSSASMATLTPSPASSLSPGLHEPLDNDDAPPPGFGGPLQKTPATTKSSAVPLERTRDSKKQSSPPPSPSPSMTSIHRGRSTPTPTPSFRFAPRHQQQQQQQQQRALFSPHWEPGAVEEALRAGRAHKGVSRFAPALSSAAASGRSGSSKTSCAYLAIPGLPVDAMVRGATAQNRALDGDEVAVVLRPPGAWWEVRSGSGGGRPPPPPPEGSSPPSPSSAVPPPSSCSSTAAGRDAQLAARAAAVGRALAAGEVEDDGKNDDESSGDDGDDSKNEKKSKNRKNKKSAPPPPLTCPSPAERALAETARILRERPELRPTAAVVAITRPSRRRARFSAVVAGSGSSSSKVEDDNSVPSSSSFFLIEPCDPRMPRLVAVSRRDAEAAASSAELFELLTREEKERKERKRSRKTLLLAEVLSWPQDSPFPIARVTEALGKRGNLAAETAALLAAESVDASDFPETALAELPALPIPAAELSRRRDLRFSRDVFSIDPPTARDLDDALSLETVEEAVAADAEERKGRAASSASAASDGEGGAVSSSSVPPSAAAPSPPPPSARWRLGVHIADVSAFVPPKGALDAAARGRATSVYLVSAVVPMLPRVLCESLCSLEPGADRLAFSADFWLDAEGRPVGSGGGGEKGVENETTPFVAATFYRSVIRSCAKLAYSDAQAMIEAGEEAKGEGRGSGSGNDDDDGDDDSLVAAAAAAGKGAFESRRESTPAASQPPLPSVPWETLALGVRRMWRLASLRRRARFDAGALRLDNTKLSFELSTSSSFSFSSSSSDADSQPQESGEPVEAFPYVQREANALVEELMLLANMAAASRISRWLPSRALLRRHPPPQERKMEELSRAILEGTGARLDVSSSGALQASLAALREEAAAAAARFPPSPAAAGAAGAAAPPPLGAAEVEVITLLCTKPMPVASYVCAGVDLLEEESSSFQGRGERGGGGGRAVVRGRSDNGRGKKKEKARRKREKQAAAAAAASSSGCDDEDDESESDESGETNSDTAVRSALARGSPRHYALAVQLYTHFTSPIRRYPDVVVHRLLAASLEAEALSSLSPPLPPSSKKDASASSPSAFTSLTAAIAPRSYPPFHAWCEARGLPSPRETALVAAHCNERKAAAKSVQDASSKLYLTALLNARPTVLDAFATGVGGSRFLDCYLPALGVEVRVQLEEASSSSGSGNGASGGTGGRRGFGGGGSRGRTCRGTPSARWGSPSPGGVAGGEAEEAPPPPRCPAHGHLSKHWSAEAKKLTLSRSPAPSSPAGTTATATSRILPLHKPLHNPGRIEPAALPLAVSHLSRVPVVVGAREGAGPGGAPELAAWLLVEGGAWAVRAAEAARNEGGEEDAGGEAQRRKKSERVSFVDDAAD